MSLVVDGWAACLLYNCAGGGDMRLSFLISWEIIFPGKVVIQMSFPGNSWDPGKYVLCLTSQTVGKDIKPVLDIIMKNWRMTYIIFLKKTTKLDVIIR
jgi:hypothetical protein